MKKWYSFSTFFPLLFLIAACAVSTETIPPPTLPPPEVPPFQTETLQLPTAFTPLPYKTPPPLPSVPGLPAPTHVGLLPPVERVITAYAKLANLQLSQIEVVLVEEVDWPNGCLGVEVPGILCIDVITPGYRIVLRVNGQTVELHSTLSGDDYRVAAP